MRKIKVKKEFTVRDEDWYRGQGLDGSALYRPLDRKKCCLGIYLHECGVEEFEMIYVGLPSSLPNECSNPFLEQLPKLFKLEAKIAAVNDATGILDAERKRKLKPLFEKMGVNIRFQDEGDKMSPANKAVATRQARDNFYDKYDANTYNVVAAIEANYTTAEAAEWAGVSRRTASAIVANYTRGCYDTTGCNF